MSSLRFISWHCTKVNNDEKLGTSTAPGSICLLLFVYPCLCNMNTSLRLYRRILKLHKNLPPIPKALGDQYLRDEFRRHKNATQEQITEFIQEWKMYADLLGRQQGEGKGFGGQLSEEQLTCVNEEQLRQLYALHQEITTLPQNSNSTERS